MKCLFFNIKISDINTDSIDKALYFNLLIRIKLAKINFVEYKINNNIFYYYKYYFS